MARARVSGAVILSFAFSASPASSDAPLVRVAAPRIVADAEVLDESGRLRALSEFTAGKITLLGVASTRCAEADPCARVDAGFRQIRSLMRADRSLQRRVRFVSLSSDPVDGVPTRLAAHGAARRGSVRGAEWHFVTTLSAPRLASILAGFKTGARTLPERSTPVFLLDGRGAVRRVYAGEALHALDVLGDVRVLLDEDRNRKSPSDDRQRTALAAP